MEKVNEFVDVLESAGYLSCRAGCLNSSPLNDAPDLPLSGEKSEEHVVFTD